MALKRRIEKKFEHMTLQFILVSQLFSRNTGAGEKVEEVKKV